MVSQSVAREQQNSTRFARIRLRRRGAHDRSGPRQRCRDAVWGCAQVARVWERKRRVTRASRAAIASRLLTSANAAPREAADEELFIARARVVTLARCDTGTDVKSATTTNPSTVTAISATRARDRPVDTRIAAPARRSASCCQHTATGNNRARRAAASGVATSRGRLPEPARPPARYQEKITPVATETEQGRQLTQNASVSDHVPNAEPPQCEGIHQRSQSLVATHHHRHWPWVAGPFVRRLVCELPRLRECS
jgi:hypothetical protein